MDELTLEEDAGELVAPRPRRQRMDAPMPRSRPRMIELDDDAEMRLREIAQSMQSFQQTAPAETAQPEKPLGLMGTIREGAKGTLRALGATVDTAQGDAQEVVRAAQDQADAPKDPDLERFYAHIEERKAALGEDPSLWEGIKAVGGAAIDNPRGFGLMIAEQLPNSGAALGAAGAGALAGSFAGPVGSAIGGLAGLAAANIGLETGHKALEAAADGDFTPKEQSRVRREGLIKGGVITGVDAATLGVTKFITNTSRRAVERATMKTLADNGVDVTNAAARRAAMETPEIAEAVTAAQSMARSGAERLGNRIAQTGGAIALETIGEGAGEYLGELAATGRANAVDAVIEGFAGFGTSIGEIATVGALNRRGLNRLLDSQEEAQTQAEKQTQDTGVEHEAMPSPTEPEKFVAVPKARSVSGIELTRDEEGNLKPVTPGSTQTEFNLANRPGFQQDAETRRRAREEERTREEAYRKNPIVVSKDMPRSIAGRPAADLTNEALEYTAKNGGARARQIAMDEIARRKAQGTPVVTPEKPAEKVKRIIATGAEKAQEDARKNSILPSVPTAPIQPATPQQAQSGNRGANLEVVLPDNTSLPAQWDVVDADTVKASIKEGKNQPRDRTRAASDIQVQGIANNPDYRRLEYSPIMDVGAPVLSADGLIVAGNGRFEGISRAFEQGTATQYLAALRADATAKGIDPAKLEGMKKPVLVRRITQPFDVRKLAIASNSGAGLQYSGLELAKIDAERMQGLENLEIADNGDIALTSSNIPNIRNALGGYSAAELGSLVDKDGKLSQEGIRRIRNAILHRAYGSSPTLERLIESSDNDLRNISGALVRAAPVAAKARADISAGRLPADLDISEQIVSAVETLSKIRAQGMTVDEYLSQAGLFGEEINEDTKAILRMLHENIRSQKKIAEFIRTYYDSVSNIDTSTDDIFGAKAPTKPELLKNAKERITEKQPDTQDLFATTRKEPEGIRAEGTKQSKDNASPPKSGEKDQQVKPANPMYWVDMYKEVAKKSGKKAAEDRARATLASQVLGRDFGKEYIPSAGMVNLKKWLDDGMPLPGPEPKTLVQKKPAFSRSAKTPKSPQQVNVESVIKAITKRWKNAPDVVIVQDMNDKAIPEAVRAENQRQLSQGAIGEPEGFIAGNKVYLVASQLKTPGDVTRVLLHESLGHFGLRGVFGQELNTVLKQVAALRRSDIEAKAKQYGLDVSKETDRLIAAEEVLAELSQNQPRNNLVQRAIAVIRAWLRNNIPGFENLKLSDAEIIEGILNPARRFVQKGRVINARAKEAAFSRNQTTTTAFKKWFEDSKVVDANGKPMIMYHGTSSDFAKFDNDVDTKGSMGNSVGFYFSASIEAANDYGSEGQVMPVYLRIKNPLRIDSRMVNHDAIGDMIGLNLSKVYGAPERAEVYWFFKNGGAYDGRKEARVGDAVVAAAKAKGYDGAIFKERIGGKTVDVYLAFDAEQIKSATGNQGTFDPNNPDIRFSRTTPSSTPTPFRERFDKIADSLIYNFQDRFKPLKDIQKRAGPVSEDADAALAEERYSGTVRARLDTFNDSMRDPLLKAIHDSGVEYEKVEEYLHALHAPSRNRAMQEINPTESELKAQVAALEKQRDTLTNDPGVKRFLDQRRKLRQAEADIEDGIADESLASVIRNEIARLRKERSVKDYADTIDRLKALRLVKPFEGDNTALSGMSDAKARQVIAEAEKSGKRAALDKISGIINQITARTREIYVEGGLEKADAIEAWNRKYENYVPLHREEVSGNGMPRVGQGFNIKGKESKRATGSTREVQNILAHVVAQHEAAIVRSEKARVDRALFQFATLNPDPSLWTLDNAPMLRTVDPVSGFVVERVDPTYKNRDEVLTLKIDGEEHTITFNEQNQEAMRLAASMKNLSSTDMGEVTQMVGRFTRFLATMNTTANPVFVARNFMRDLQTAYVNLSDTEIAGKKREVFRNIPDAIRGMWNLSRGKKSSKWAKYAQEFKAAGGQTGWMEHYKDIGTRADALKKELATMQPGKLNASRRALKSWWGIIEDANNAVENGARLSAYVAARQSGLSEGKAASIAKNLTVNFNARGAKSVELNAWFMFMNASIQGSARLIKAMNSRQVRKIVAGVVLSGFLMDILARAMAGDDDEDGENDYDQLPEHTKAMNFVFMVDGQPVTIPMPYGYNFFASAGRKMSEMIFRENYSPVRSAVDLAAVFVDAFSPTGQAGSALQFVAPTIADPAVQWAENKNFAGNPLRREQHPFGVPNPEYQMGFKSTSAPAKWLAESLNTASGGNEVRPGFVNVNPAFFDFAVSSIAGGAGRTYLQVASGPLKATGDDKIQAREVPFLNIFVGARPEYQTERKYFEAVREVEMAQKELKTYREKGDIDMVRRIREEHRAALRLIEAEKEAKRILSNLRRRDLALDKVGLENKGQLRREIEEKRREVMARFNRQYREAMNVQ